MTRSLLVLSLLAATTPPSPRVPFRPAVRAGDLVFSSGQIGMDAHGQVPRDMATAAPLALAAVDKALMSEGARIADAVKCTVMLADMRDWPAFNAAYARFFDPARLPARSAFAAKGLAFDATVEVDCIAYKPLRR